MPLKKHVGKKKILAKQKGLVQQTFLKELFAKPSPIIVKNQRKSRLERANLLKAKLDAKISNQKKHIEASNKMLEINRVSMGSFERHLELESIQRARNRLLVLEKRLGKVASIAKTESSKKIAETHMNQLKRIREAQARNKFLSFPKKRFLDVKSRQEIISFSKKIKVSELERICHPNLSQDWEIIHSRHKDVLNREKGKSKSFSKSSGAFLWDVYRISQSLVMHGSPNQQKYGLGLFNNVELLLKKVK